LDQRGVTIPGRISSKSESVSVHYSTWSRSAQVTVEYQAPDAAGVSFFNTELDPDRYDLFHVGQPVTLRYLLRKDIPELPLSSVLREIHALPMVRLADQRAFAGIAAVFEGNGTGVWRWIAGAILVLATWRIAGWPRFGWAVGIFCVAGLTAVLVEEFPTPTPRPANNVRQASGRVRSVDRIDRLFSGSRSRGVPAGRTESVVAVDLIDAGSIPGLKLDSMVTVQYEAETPRTAYLQNATRKFVRRNLNGIILQAALYVGVLVAFWAAAQWIGRAFHRLIERAGSRRG
jgi:hypothetical protein